MYAPNPNLAIHRAAHLRDIFFYFFLLISVAEIDIIEKIIEFFFVDQTDTKMCIMTLPIKEELKPLCDIKIMFHSFGLEEDYAMFRLYFIWYILRLL